MTEQIPLSGVVLDAPDPRELARFYHQLHLDFQVTDLEQAQQRAVEAGATLMDWQPQKEGVRIFADPVGHVFCLFLPGW
ncbi:VOC family protein [Kribbella monticola]|uniref:VOC family protein n=1 Tax=Kribbella monticola TaxID=2185285 RepID=UPI000DD49A8A|nr:VOC family protein [Kribbella monticola]